VQAAAIAGGLMCSYSTDGAVLAVGLVMTKFRSVTSVVVIKELYVSI